MRTIKVRKNDKTRRDRRGAGTWKCPPVRSDITFSKTTNSNWQNECAWSRCYKLASLGKPTYKWSFDHVILLRAVLLLTSENGVGSRNGEGETLQCSTGSAKARMVLQSFWSWLRWPGLYIPTRISHWMWVAWKDARPWAKELSAARAIFQDPDPWRLSADSPLGRWDKKNSSLKRNLTNHGVCHITRGDYNTVAQRNHSSYDRQHFHISKLCCSNFFGKSNEVLCHNNKRSIQSLTPKSFCLKTTSCTSCKVSQIRY